MKEQCYLFIKRRMNNKKRNWSPNLMKENQEKREGEVERLGNGDVSLSLFLSLYTIPIHTLFSSSFNSWEKWNSKVLFQLLLLVNFDFI